MTDTILFTNGLASIKAGKIQVTPTGGTLESLADALANPSISGTAGAPGQDGGNASITGGSGGAGASGNAGGVLITGGQVRSTNGDGGSIFITASDATGSGNGGSLGLSAGSSGSGSPGVIQIASQMQFTSGTPSIAAGSTINGTDQTGLILVGSGPATSVRITFGGKYDLPPDAVVISPANATAAGATIHAYVDQTTLDQTGFTLVGAILANCQFFYHAF